MSCWNVPAKFTDRAGGRNAPTPEHARCYFVCSVQRKRVGQDDRVGVNDGDLQPDDAIISNTSCTTNNAAPMLKILDDHFGIESRIRDHGA